MEAQYYAKRKRNLRLHIMVNSDELATIQERMKELDIHNQSAFLRKMAVYGYAVNIDITPAKELIFLQRRCVNNLARIAKYAQANNAYKGEIMELQKGYAELWEQYSTLLEHLARLVALSDFRSSWLEVKLKKEWCDFVRQEVIP